MGSSLAVSTIADMTLAFIAGSTVVAAGEVDILAESNASIWSLTIAGAAAGAGGAGGGLAGAIAGSASINTVRNVVEASIVNEGDDGSLVTLNNGGLTLSAMDNTLILSNSGGFSFAGAGGAGGGVALSVGASLAVNTTVNEVRSHISGSKVTSVGSIADPDVVALDLSSVGVISAEEDRIDLGFGHGLETGTAVTYGNGGDTSIAGLENGEIYYAIVDEHDFSTQGDLDADSDTIDLQDNHGYATGDAVVYHSGGGHIGGLVDGETYHVIAVEEDHRFNVAHAVNSDADTIDMGAGHGIKTGDALIYRSGGGGAINALLDGETYYAILSKETFVAGDVAVAGEANPNSVDFGSDHGFVTGDEVIYSSGGRGTIGGLIDGGIYYLVVAGDHVSLAATAGGAVLALAVTEECSDSHTLTSTGKIHLAASRDAAIAGEAFEIEGATATGTQTLRSATRVQLANVVGGAAIDLDLATATGFHHSLTAADSFGLATTLADALAHKAIEIDGESVNGRHNFVQANVIELSAISNATSWALTLAGAASGAGGAAGGLAASGAAASAANTIVNTVESLIQKGSSVISAGDATLTVAAQDSSLIMANAGGGAFAGAGGAGGGVAVAEGASLAVNTIINHVTGSISDSTTTINGDIEVSAKETATIWALTIAGAASGAGGAGGGLAGSCAASGSVNTVANSVEASIKGGGKVTTTGGGRLSLTASDQSLIMANAGGASFAGAGGAGGGGAAAVGASLAVNTIVNSAKAFISGTTVETDGDLGITADSEATIWALTIAGAISGSGGAGGGVSVSGAASSSVNTIVNRIKSGIKGGSKVVTNSGGALTVTATDHSTILANSGGAAFSGAGGAGGGVTVTAGASMAVNTISNAVQTFVSGSTLEVDGNLSMDAQSNATIWALTIAGAGGGSGGAIGGVSVSGGASSSVNVIVNSAESLIDASSVVTTKQSGSDLYVLASDNSLIMANAGAASADGAGGGVGGVTVSLGASVAVNDITNTVSARVSGSTLDAAGSVELEARSTATIWALTIAGAGGGSGGAVGGVSVSGAGSSSVNVISNDVIAAIEESSVTTRNVGGIQVTAEDVSLIMANAGGASFAGAGGAIGGVTVSIAGSIAVNVIANRVETKIIDSTLDSVGDVCLLADSSASIWALTVAGSGGGSGGAIGGVSVAGAASNSANVIANTIAATVTGSTVTTHNNAAVTMDAVDNSLIMANAGGASAAGAGGAIGGVTVTLGGSAAVNVIANSMKTTISGSTVSADGDVELSALSNSTIWALTVAGAGGGSGGAIGGVSLAGAASGSVNVIANTIEALIEADSDVTAEHSGTVSLSASDTSLIMANAGGASAAGAGGAIGGVVATVGASSAVNTISNTILASVINSEVTSSGVSGAAEVISIDLAGTGSLKAEEDQIDAGSAHNLATGNAVVYESAGEDIEGLVEGKTYYVITEGADFNAVNDVNSVTRQIELGQGHGFSEGDAVVYHNESSGGGEAIGGLEDGQTYYVIENSESYSLDLPKCDNENSTITASGHTYFTGDEVLYHNGGGSSVGGLEDGKSYFVIADNNEFNPLYDLYGRDDAIDLGVGASYETGDAVIYSSGGGSSIGGLTNGATYYVVVDEASSQRVRLSLSYDDATAGTPQTLDLDLNGATGNSHSLTKSHDIKLAASKDDALAGHFIVFDTSTATGNGHRLDSNRTIQLAATAGGAAIDLGTSLGTGNRHSLTSTTCFALADSKADALAGNRIDLGESTLIGTHAFTRTDQVDLTAVSDATIWSLTMGGAGSGSGGAIGGVSVSGAGAASANIIANRVEASIVDGSQVTTENGNGVSLTAIDSASIMVNAGGSSFSGSGGVIGGVSASFGAAMAVSDIRNNVQAFISASTVDSDGDVAVEAKENASIWTLSLGGSFAGSGGAVGISVAGAGSVATNLIYNTISAFVDSQSEVNTVNGGDLTISALDNAGIVSNASAQAITTALSVAGASLSIGTVVAVNEIGNNVHAFIDGASVDVSGAVGVTAGSTADIESRAVAVAVAASVSPFSLGIAGSGADANNKVESTISAYIKDSTSIKAVGDLAVSALDSSTVYSDVGAGALASGAIGASVGISVATNTINNTLKSYVAASTLGSQLGGIRITALSSGSIESLGVATSMAILPTGVAEAGGFAVSTIGTTVEAYVDSGSIVTEAGDILISARSDFDARTQTYGVSGGAVAAGQSVAVVNANGSINAHFDGTITGADNVTVKALAQNRAEATATALAGGVLAVGGAVASAQTNPTVSAYLGDGANITTGNSVVIDANAEVAADATSRGYSAAIAGAVGVSSSTAEASPHVNAYVGVGSTIHTGNLTISARQSRPTDKNSAAAYASGGSGGLLLGVNATLSKAFNKGHIQAYVGDDSSLTVSGATTIKAHTDSRQYGRADGFAGGLLAVGANVATADSDTVITSYLGSRVTLSGGELIIEAGGENDNFASGVAGSGALIAGSAVEALTINRSLTTAYTSDALNSTSGSTINVDSMTLTADFTTGFNSKTDSSSAGALGMSGATANNLVEANVDVTLGKGTHIDTLSLTVSGTNTIVKDWLPDTAEDADTSADYNVIAGAGGAIGTSAASSNTGIAHTTDVAVADDAYINVANAGTLSISANNILIARDKAKLTAAGAIAVARAESFISNDTWFSLTQEALDALKPDVSTGIFTSLECFKNRVFIDKEKFIETLCATIGSDFTSTLQTLVETQARHAAHAATIEIGNADLQSSGDINLSARTQAVVETMAHANTYGAASYAQGETGAIINATNQVLVKAGACLESEGDLNLTAGSDQKNVSALKAKAGTDLWNKSLLSISSPPIANAEIDENNHIDVKTEAWLGSAQDVNFNATKGTLDAQGSWRYQDLYQQLAQDIANGIVNLFTGSGDTVSLVETGGSDRAGGISTVTIDGVVESGIHRQQTLEIGPEVLTFVPVSMTGAPTLTFNGNSLTRTSGSWLDDGFTVGEYFTVAGSNSNNGAYKIAAVTATTLQLLGDAIFVEETNGSAGLQVMVNNVGTSSAPIRLSGAPSLIFKDVVGGNEISRSAGSWLSDGFAAGQFIRVVGTTPNAGSYQIASVTNAIITLVGGQDIIPGTETADVIAQATRIQQVALSGTPVLSYLPQRAAIVRDTGSWISDGFTVGMQIQLSGTDSNNAIYTIATLSATRIELQESTDLHAGTDADAAVTSDLATTTADLTYEQEKLHLLPSVQWASGDWASEGFVAGQVITISDSSGNNGSFTIASVTGDSIDLKAGSILTATTDTDGLTVTRDVSIASDQTLTFTAQAGDVLARVTWASGDWETEGFKVGGQIRFSGTDSNNDIFTIASVSGDTITLTTGSGVVDETDSDGATATKYVAILATDDVIFSAEQFATPAKIIKSTPWSSAYIAGRQLVISDAGNNNGTYQIASVSGATISLANGAVLTDALDDNSTVVIQLAMNSGMTFTARMSDSAEIIRSTGSWITDGFVADQLFSITGSGSNNGIYRVQSVSASVIELTPASNLTLATAVSSVGVSISHTEEVAAGLPDGVSLLFHAGLTATIEINNGNAEDSWLDYGYRAGQTIEITGLASNDGSYVIDSLTAKVITLTSSAVLTSGSGTSTDIKVIPLSSCPATKPIAMSGSPDLTFNSVAKTIVRTSGSWADDGFQAGNYISIIGTVSNGNNDGNYRISAIAADGKTLTLYDAIHSATNFSSGSVQILSVPIRPGGIDIVNRPEGVADPVVKVEDMARNITDKLYELQALKISYTGIVGSVDAIAGINAQINQLERQLHELGLVSDTDPGLGNDDILVSAVSGYGISVIEVPNFTVQAGDITINAGTLIGSGDLKAPLDAELKVINNSPYYLRLLGLSIVDGGGTIRFNGARVSNIDDITAHNVDGQAATFTSIVTSLNSDDPLINIENNFDPSLLSASHRYYGAPAPDIEIVGDVSNIQGTLRITNERGSIVIKGADGSINAKTIDMDAGRDVTIASDIMHVNGDPVGQWDSEATIWEEKDKKNSSNDYITANQNGTNNVAAIPVTDKSIVAGNNVIITARLLNINGLVQSGRPDRHLVLLTNQNAVMDAYKASGATALLQLTAANSDIDAYYNPVTDRIEVESIAVEGGYMQLTGQIMSTASSKLRVVDGFGDIDIDNQTNRAVDIRSIDTGKEGIEGKLVITDTAYHIAGGAPLTTTYTRIGDKIQITDNDSSTADVPDIAGRNATYNTLDNQRYYWLTGNDSSTVQVDKWIYRSVLGVSTSWLVADPPSPPTSTDITQNLPAVALPDGVFVAVNASDNNLYSYQWDEVTLSKTTIWTSEINSYGWWIFSYQEETATKTTLSGYKEFHTHSVKADYDINIEFSGHDTGTVTIDSTTDINLAGPIRNAVGTVTLSTQGDINQLSLSGVLQSENITLNSTGSVGSSDAAIRTDLLAGTLNATTINGSIYLNELNGDLRLGVITAGNGDIVASADMNLLAASGSLLTGTSVELNARNGSIGSAGAGNAIRVDTDAVNGGGLNGWATGDIYLEETVGDLNLESLIALNGDVQLKVTDGGLFDVNNRSTADTRAISLLTKLWNDMALTGAAAEAAATQNIESYEGMKTRGYKSYWNYRSQQTDSSDFNVTLSESERAYYRDTLGWSAAAIDALELKRTDEFKALHKDWNGIHGNSYDAAYRYDVEKVVGNAEYDALMVGHSWTQSELENSINAGSLRAKTDTEVRIEEANIVAGNVTLDVAHGVGTTLIPFDIDLSLGFGSLSPEEKVLMAAAERDDMAFLDADGLAVNPLDATKTVATLRITIHDDLDVEATGGITIDAGDHIYLGAEQDINVESIVAGGGVRIKTGGGIVNFTDNGTVNVTGAGIILEAATSAIGAEAAPLFVQLTGVGTTLTARALQDIFLTATQGNLAIDTLYSKEGGAILQAKAGSIIDGNKDAEWNISVVGDLSLNAVVSIGAAGNALDTDLHSLGVYNAVAGQDIHLTETVGNMLVGLISAGEDVSLTAAGSILDAGGEANGLPGNPDADVVANNITLTALSGSIGDSYDDFDIDTAHSGAGVLTSISSDNAYLIETVGNLYLNQVSTGLLKTAFIMGPQGIYNGRTDEEDNILSGFTRLYAASNIGASDKYFRTAVGFLEGKSVAGDVWIHNNGHLTVGGVSGEGEGINTLGKVNIVASSPITVTETIQAADILITANDDATDGTPDSNDDLIVKDGVTLWSTSGKVTLRAGDDLIIEKGATVRAAGAVELFGDFGNADAGVGSIMDLQGTIEGSSLEVTGAGDKDTVVLFRLAGGMSTTVRLGAGDDSLLVGSQAKVASNHGGIVDDLDSLLTVHGGEGDDTLTVDDSGDATDNVGILTDNSITGLGMAKGIVYDALEQVDIALGSGSDAFTVASSMTGTTTITAGLGADEIEIQDSAGTLTVQGEGGQDTLILRGNSGDVTLSGGTDDDLIHVGSASGGLNAVVGAVIVDGGAGNNTLTVDDSGDGTDNDGTLTDSRISGLGLASGISYGAIETVELRLGSGSDTFTVASSITGTTTVTAGLGADAIEIQGSRGMLMVRGDGGQDALTLRGNAGAVTLAGGADDDLIHVGSASGELSAVVGAVTVDGGSGEDTLTVDDSGDAADNVGSITDSTISGLGMGSGINYAGVEAVTASLGSGRDKFTVQGTISGLTRIAGGAGNDVIAIQGNAGTLAVKGEGGRDTLILRATRGAVTLLGGDDDDRIDIGGVFVGVNAIAASVTVDGGTGTDTLNVNDSGDVTDNVGILTDTRITGLGMSEGVLYGSVEQINIDLGSGHDLFNVRSTTNASSSCISGGGGDDTFNLSSEAPAAEGNLNGIRGDLHLDGGAGNNTLNLSDRGDRSGRTGLVLSESGISGFGDAEGRGTISYETSGTFGGGVNLLLGSGADDVTVVGAMSDAVTTLRTGDGDDQVRFRDESAGDDGMVVCFGEGGADTVDASAWNSDLVLLGDDGIVSYRGAKSPETLMHVQTLQALGDSADRLRGGTGNDLLLGGQGADQLSGGAGDDILMGDGGRVTYMEGQPRSIETVDLFKGGNDILSGGGGNDIMMGGAGNDTFYGSLSEDIIIGEYGRITIKPDGKVESTVRLAQGNLDLLASTQFELYRNEKRQAEPTDLGVRRPFDESGTDVPSLRPMGDSRGSFHGTGITLPRSPAQQHKQENHTPHPVAEPERKTSSDGQDGALRNYSGMPFAEAFEAARADGLESGDSFIWNGRVYDAGLEIETGEKALEPGSFAEAFARARENCDGEQCTFIWKGKVYRTILEVEPEHLEGDTGTRKSGEHEPQESKVNLEDLDAMRLHEKAGIVAAGSMGWGLFSSVTTRKDRVVQDEALRSLDRKMKSRRYNKW